MKQFIILDTNLFTKKVMCLPGVISTKEEADKEVERRYARLTVPKFYHKYEVKEVI